MKLTLENLKDLELHQYIWVNHYTDLPNRMTFMGKLGINYFFIDKRKTITIYENSSSIDQLREMFTTYEESCIRLKEHIVHLIDHYNSHQLKDFPIVVEEIKQKGK